MRWQDRSHQPAPYPFYFISPPRLSVTILDLAALPYQIASRRRHLGNVPFQHLVPELSLIYSIRLSSKSVVIFASYSCEIRDLRAVFSMLDMLTYPFYLLSKPNSPFSLIHTARLLHNTCGVEFFCTKVKLIFELWVQLYINYINDTQKPFQINTAG